MFYTHYRFYFGNLPEFTGFGLSLTFNAFCKTNVIFSLTKEKINK